MAEDIDDLLEEVESKFLTKDKKSSKSKSNRKEKRLDVILHYMKHSLHVHHYWICNVVILLLQFSRDNDYDIDDLLDDIKVEPIPKVRPWFMVLQIDLYQYGYWYI